MRSIALMASSLIATPLFASPALASPPDTHTGLMLRFAAGFGVDFAGDSEDDVTVTIGGPGVAIEAAVGGYVMPKLAIHGELWASATPDPELTVSNGSEELTLQGDGTMSFFGIGAGVTYWIGNIDLYLAGSLGIGKVVFSDDDPDSDDLDTDFGLAGKFSVGKQWMVSRDWGIGVTGALTLGSLQDSDSEEAALFLGVHALFSVTFH